MKNYIRSKVLASATLLIAAVAAVLWTPSSQAAMRCEEIVQNRSCADGGPRTFTGANGLSGSVPAPHLDGFPSACWAWNRQFQCIETDPKYTCASGTNYDTVKQDCSLTTAAVHATMSINGVQYITSATYNYSCAWGEWTSNQTLPPNRECVLLETPPPTDVASTPNLNTGAPVVTDQTRTDQYVCYLPQVTECANTCYEHVQDPVSGLIVDKEVPCESPVTNCSATSRQCEGTYAYNPATDKFETTSMLGPDGRCIQSNEMSQCQSGAIPKCLDQANCTLASVTPADKQSNGQSLSEEQTYVCSNETKTCTQYTNVSNCVHVNAWGWDNMSLTSEIGQGLAEANEALARIEGIEKGQKKDDPYIFSGQDMRCHFAVGNWINTFITVALIAVTLVVSGGTSIGLMGTALQGAGFTMGQAAAIQIGLAAVADAPDTGAFGKNCCKDNVIVEGSDKWYKLGACSADEVRLGVARKKDLDVYLGEYCSKKGGFPVRQCKEKTRTYCVFDDMLAKVVNEQGRMQLDQLAIADPVTTKTTEELHFGLFSQDTPDATKYAGVLDNGKWVKQFVENKSQLWSWQYPGYCVSKERQEAAYSLYLDELNALADTKGIKPDKMTKDEAALVLRRLLNAPSFQECGSTPGVVEMLSCSKQDDSCDQSRLPESPNMVESESDGTTTQSDVNWRVGAVRSFFMPGDYGVTALMADNSYAAVTKSVNEFITSVGSCHTDGACLFKFAVTDKTANGGMGSQKRTADSARFPLYSTVQSSHQASIPYVAKDGTLDMAAYQADPNRGLAEPFAVTTHRFILHPNYITKKQVGQMHSHVLLEYANTKKDVERPENDYIPLMLPTSLPKGTAGWYPYGDANVPGKYFYISGGCDPDSHWCDYTIEVDLNVPRHPWGSAREPRCWGFSLDQMAALDFNKMDLSKWINSLDFGTDINGMSTTAADAMAQQATSSAQAFYGAMKNGETVTKPNPGSASLVVNSEILPYISGDDYGAYVLQAAVPTNWPSYYIDQENNNPVTNVKVNWGDGSPIQSMPRHPKGQAFLATHDYGDKPVGSYTIKVTMDTAANGPQQLTKKVTITPSDGTAPAKEGITEFNNPGTNGSSQSEYTPSSTANGTSQAPANLETVAPGMADQFERQGATLDPVPAKTTKD